MKRKFFSVSLIVLLLVLIFSTCSFAERKTWRVGSAKELQTALDDDSITDIVITSSLSGNFVVPRWVYSISGNSQAITIRPDDESKPVFDAESSTKKNLVRAVETYVFWPLAVGHAMLSAATADDLAFSNLTIMCGTSCGIDTNSISKLVRISNVTFKGIRENCDGFHPSTTSRVEGCTFENLTWGVSTVDSANYDLKIRNCTFKNVSQALSVSRAGSGASCSIENCKGENVGWWVIHHEATESTMYVTVDQNTINSYAGSDYEHKITGSLGYESTQLTSYMEDLSRNFNNLPYEAKKLIFREGNKGWDNIRVFAMSELNKKLRDIDPEDKLHSGIDECLSLYSLLACAPVASLFDTDDSVEMYVAKIFTLCTETLKNCVKEDNLIIPIISAFLNPRELEPLSKTAPRLSWGNTGNVREAFSSNKIEQIPDRIFRENIHRLQDWLTALDDVKGKMNQLKNALHDDYQYASEFERKIRAIYDLGVASNRVAAAIFFDLPTDVAFASNFARVTREENPSRITGICRELGPFYSVSQRLCVLNRTNTIRDELLKLWKNKLVETHLFGSDNHSRYENLITSLSTDPDLMRDATRVNDFFREWR